MTATNELWTSRKEEAKKRLDICKTCDKFNQTLFKCNECGCFMIAKTLLPFSECPLNKWGSSKETNETQN
jgi:hypothetical protein